MKKPQEAQTDSERKDTDFMKEDGFQEYLRARTLSNTCPILADFLKPGMSVLDVGCSSGSITLDVARAVGDGHVVGIDPGEDAVAKAAAEAEKVGVSNAEFLTGDTYSLDFEDDSFDLVYSNAVFCWLRDPVAALKEHARVCFGPTGAVSTCLRRQ